MPANPQTLAPTVPITSLRSPAIARELDALLQAPSLADAITSVSAGLIAWATPSLRPDAQSALELSVSTARMPTPDGEPLGAPGDEAGPFGRAARLAALAFGADHAVFGVNGSSGLNHLVARVLAMAPEPHVLVPVNTHHSLLDALTDTGVAFSRIGANYIPDFEALEPPTITDVEAAVAAAGSPVTAIVLSSPTYEGLHADVAGVAAVARRIGAALVVDAAWGSHVPFMEGGAPIAAGADLVVTSLHKTGGARQQNALLLHRDGTVDWHDVRRAGATVTTTSPSYPMLADIDATVRWLLTEAADAFAHSAALVRRFATALRDRHGDLELLGGQVGVDPLRVTIGALGRRRLTGYVVSDRLVSRGVVAEKRGSQAITFIAPLTLTREAVDATLEALEVALAAGAPDVAHLPAAASPFADADLKPALSAEVVRLLVGAGRVERVVPGDAIGRISAYRTELYPPGIPLLLPGFRVSAGAVGALAEAGETASIVSTGGDWDGRVAVLSHE
jgi:lysine decarboxylase